MKYLRLFVFGAFAGVCLLLWLERRSGDQTRQELAVLEEFDRGILPQLHAKQTQLAGEVRTFTRWRTIWDTIIRVDTLPGDTVRIPVTVLVAADSTIRSCAIALTTCQQLAALERERADSLERQRDLWKGLAHGPFLRPSAELLFAGSHPRAAAQLEAGHRLSALARLEVDTLSRFWAGLRYEF